MVHNADSHAESRDLQSSLTAHLRYLYQGARDRHQVIVAFTRS